MKRLLILTLFLTCFLSEANGDSYDKISNRYLTFTTNFSPEKVFLVSDKDLYTTGENIHFTCFLQNSSYLSEINESNYIYVEIIDPQTLDTERVMIKRRKDGFYGYLRTPVKEGKYYLRAYTKWMLNAPPENIYVKEIYVSDTGIAPKKKNLQSMEIHFVPESGNYLLGTETNMGVVTLGYDHKPISLSGVVHDSKTDRVITRFKTDINGCATFRHRQEMKDDEYYVVFSDTLGYSLKLAIPSAVDTAAVINLRHSKSMLTVRFTFSESLKSDSLSALFFNSSELYHAESLSSSGQIIRISKNNMTPGIHSVAIIDKNYNVLSTRSFFISELKNELNSYMLLGSELKNRYPISLKSSASEIDAYMSTVIWNYYNLKFLFTSNNFTSGYNREYSQSLSGKVSPLPKNSKMTEVTFIAPRIKYAYTTKLDSSGRFFLTSLDFPDSTAFTAVKFAGRYEYKISFDEPVFAPPYEKIQYETYYAERKGEENNNESTEEEISQEVELLDAAVVTSNRIVPRYNPAPNTNFEFKKHQIRQLSDMDSYTNMDLFSYVVHTFPGIQIRYVLVDDAVVERTLMTHVPRYSTQFTISDGWAPIIVYLNHKRVPISEIENLYVGEIISLALLTGNEADFFCQSSYGGMYSSRGVLMIYTKSFAKGTRVGNAYPMGWQR